MTQASWQRFGEWSTKAAIVRCGACMQLSQSPRVDAQLDSGLALTELWQQIHD